MKYIFEVFDRAYPYSLETKVSSDKYEDVKKYITLQYSIQDFQIRLVKYEESDVCIISKVILMDKLGEEFAYIGLLTETK